jgi:hypothetical protein
LRNPSRRSFLGTLAAVLPAATLGSKRKTNSDSLYRFATANCEIEMSVKSYGTVATDDLGFIDRVTKRRFCVPASGRTPENCVAGFHGALAVAIYRFLPQSSSRTPGQIREHVVTIDHDRRINPRPPVEEFVTVEKDVASDIQAFGYAPDTPGGPLPPLQYAGPWALMRQDLYLDSEMSAFLIVHWKHTLESIQLVDVIPGDGTRMISVS